MRVAHSAEGWTILLEAEQIPDQRICDDGPDPTYTPQVLDMLAQEKVKGTFFAIARAVAARPECTNYNVWCTYDRQIYWFSLKAGEYQPLAADAQEMIRSRQFLGPWLAPEALLAHDLASVLRVLQQGIAAPEHQAFVQILTET